MPADAAADDTRGGAPGWQWLLAAYSVTSLIEAIGISQVFAFLPLRLRELGLAERDVAAFTGVFTALIFAVGIFLVPFWGVWADKFSRRAVIVRSAVVEAVVFAGVAAASAPWQLAAALMLTGLQLGNTGVMLAALRDVGPPRRIGTLSAIFSATGPVGFALGPILGGVVVDGLHLPLTAVYWADAALSAAIVVLLLGTTREVRPAVIPTGRSLDLALGALRSVLGNRGVLRLFAVFGIALLGNQMTRPYLPLVVQHLVGTGPGLASSIGAVVGLAALVGALVSPVSGPLGDALGLRRVLVAALLLAGLALWPMAVAPGVPALAGLVVLFAAAYAAVQAMVFALLAVEAPPERRSATLNLIFMPLYVAGIIGPSLSAGFAATLGIPAIYPAAGTIMILGSVLVARALRREARHAARLT